MRNYLFIVLFIGCSSALYSQMNATPFYWIKFKDKNNDGYSLNSPNQFLSQASIDRRTRQGILLDETDLPVTQNYIDSVSPYLLQLVHRLKWFNMIIVQLGDSTINADSIAAIIRQFPFVDSMSQIQYPPYKSLLQTNKFESTTPVNQNIVYPNIYGAPYHQLNMVDGDLLQQLGYRGQGITIAMMDNGCDGIDTLHYFDSVRPRILDTWNFVFNQPSILVDPLGSHGTSTFSCIGANTPNVFIGAAPDANFCLYQSEDNNAEWIMEEYHWAAAAERADSMGAQIFSTSLGYTLFDYNIGNTTYAELNGNTTPMTQAGNIAFSKGILVLNSAGNEGADEGPNPWYYIIAPADGDSIMAVGSVDSDRAVSNFSSRGFQPAKQIKPDICAMGHVTYCVTPSGYISTSGGTSFSCPISAGCAACLWQAFPDKTAKDIYSAIKRSADHFNDPDTTSGYGIPSFYDAYLMLLTNYNGNIVHINHDVGIYPNPFSSTLNISVYDLIAANHSVEIFDLSGRKVFSTEITTLRDNNMQFFSLQGLDQLENGEYILCYDHKKESSHKIVKMNTK
jgi:serine protease AprX